jgi:hypothetical protein
MTCEEIHPIIFCLFIYSIVWRCSISSCPTYNEFKLNQGEEESLRIELMKFKYEKQADLLLFLTSVSSLIVYPYLLFTSLSFRDKTGNMVFTNPAIKNPYQLALGEYMLILSFEPNELQDHFVLFNNVNISKPKVVFLVEHQWNLFRQQILGILQDGMLKDYQQTGQMPWLFRNSMD